MSSTHEGHTEVLNQVSSFLETGHQSVELLESIGFRTPNLACSSANMVERLNTEKRLQLQTSEVFVH